MPKPLGPGPAYMLASTVGYDKHDCTRHRYPMYTFGTKGGLGGGTKSPGPVYDLKQMTARGAYNVPAYSFGAQLPKGGRAIGPGPAGYSPEYRNNRPPIYSFGIKLNSQRKGIGPGPMAYDLRSKGTAFAYSMAKRYDDPKSMKSPGPAAHFQQNIEVYKPGMPKYSIANRLGGGGRKLGPGPACVGPNLYIRGDSPYKFSFGIKHNEWTNPMIVEADNIGCK